MGHIRRSIRLVSATALRCIENKLYSDPFRKFRNLEGEFVCRNRSDGNVKNEDRKCEWHIQEEKLKKNLVIIHHVDLNYCRNYEV